MEKEEALFLAELAKIVSVETAEMICGEAKGESFLKEERTISESEVVKRVV